MKAALRLKKINRFIDQHPLASRHRWRVYFLFCRWQLLSRLAGGPLTARFTAKTRLRVRQGMAGATGNIYLGLHDFAEMGFLLHFMRTEDLFLDIGANVGAYTVLASAHVGCRSVAFEPAPQAYQALLENLAVNRAAEKVKTIAAAVGAKPGKTMITEALDARNHVVRSNSTGNPGTKEVSVVTVDETLGGNDIPALVKIDVEGFEWEVLQGAQSLLSNGGLKAIIIELNGSGGHYGYSDEGIHGLLMAHSFRPFAYDPFQRKLVRLESFGTYNTIYLRDINFVQDRVQSAAPVTVLGETF